VKTKGLKILKVAPGGPADKVGLLEGEYVQSLDGNWVTTGHQHFQNVITTKAAGDTVRMQIYNDSSRASRHVFVALGGKSEEAGSSSSHRSSQF